MMGWVGRGRASRKMWVILQGNVVLTIEQMAKGPLELSFKKNKNLTWSQQMGIIVAILVRAGHDDWIRWVIEVSCLEQSEDHTELPYCCSPSR